jgi:hypothetical protein
MALGNTSNAIYLTISDGKVVRQFKTPTAHSVERTTKTNKLVHEERYDFVEGLITAIATRENDYGKFWNITLQDGEETYIIQFNYSGGTAAAFLKTLPNVQLDKPVKLTPKQTIDGEKKKSTLFINQGGNALKWYWNKDNPGELPQLKKVKVKGKEQWDDSDMMEFLENYVRSEIMPQLAGFKTPVPVDNDSQIDEEAPF